MCLKCLVCLLAVFNIVVHVFDVLLCLVFDVSDGFDVFEVFDVFDLFDVFTSNNMYLECLRLLVRTRKTSEFRVIRLFFFSVRALLLIMKHMSSLETGKIDVTHLSDLRPKVNWKIRLITLCSRWWFLLIIFAVILLLQMIPFVLLTIDIGDHGLYKNECASHLTFGTNILLGFKIFWITILAIVVVFIG